MEGATPPAPPPPAPRRRSWRWRVWARRLAWSAALVLGLLLVALLGVWLWLQSAAGNRWLRDRVDHLVDGALAEGTFDIGELRTNLVTGLEVTDVHLRDGDGHEVIGADRLAVRYSLLPLLGGRVAVRELRSEGLVFDMEVDEDGRSSFHRLFGPPAPPDPDAPPFEWKGLPVDIVVGLVALEQSHVRFATPARTLDVTSLDLHASASLLGKEVSLRDLELTGLWLAPEPGPLHVGGGASWNGDVAELSRLAVDTSGSHLRIDGRVTGLQSDPDVDVTVDLDPADLFGVDAFLGGIGLGGRWDGQLQAVGPLSELRVSGSLDGVEEARGGLDVDVVVDLAGDLAWEGTVGARTLHAEDAYTPLSEMVTALGDQIAVDGTFEVSGGGTKWPEELWAKATFDGDKQRIYGMDFDTMALEASLEDGVLGIDSLVTTGPMGALDGRGTIDIARGPLDLRLWGTFDARELERFKAEGFTGRGRLDARFTGDPRADVPVYTTRGKLWTWGLTYWDQEIKTKEAQADVTVYVRKSGVEVRADVRGAGADVYGVGLETVHEPDLRVEYLYDGNLSVSGDVEAERVAMPGIFSFATAAGPWDVTRPPSGDSRIQAEIDVGAFTLLDLARGTTGIGVMDLQGDELQFGADLADRGRSVLDTAGTLMLESKDLRLAHLALSPVAGRRYVSDGPAHLRLSEYGGITDADIALEGAPGERLEVRGTLGTAGPLDAEVDVQHFDLGLVAELYPESLGYLSGDLSLRATLGGTAEAAEVKGDLDVVGTFLDGQSDPLAVKGTFEGADDALLVDLGTKIADAPLLDARGLVPVHLALSSPGLDPDGDADLELVLRPGDLARLEALTGTSLAVGDGSGVLHVRGALRDPSLELAAVVESRVQGWTAPGRLELLANREEGRLDFSADVYEGLSERAVVDGNADDHLDELIAWAVAGGPEPDFSSYSAFASSIAADARLTGLPIESLLALAGTDAEATGRLVGDLQLRGAPDTPVVEADVVWVDGSLARVPVEQGRLTLEPSDDGYVVDLRLETKDGSFNAAGEVPVYLDLRKDPRSWVTGDIALSLEARALPLALFEAFLPDVREAKGELMMVGVVGGSIVDPEPMIALAIRGGELAYLPVGVRYTDISLSALASGGLARVKSLTLRTEPIRQTTAIARGTSAVAIGDRKRPHLELSGDVTLVDWAPAEVAAKVHLQDFWVSALSDRLLRIGGDMAVSGTWPALSVRGDAAVQSGYIKLDSAAFLSQESLELDRRLVLHREGVAGDFEIPEEEPPVWYSFDIAVGIQMSRNLELAVVFPFLTSFGQLGAALTTANMSARLGGGLDFQMQGGEYAVKGDVEVVDGRVGVLRSNFTLQEGVVSFQGDPTNPFLDLSARMEAGSTYLDMHVRGSASEPDISFTSPDYSDDTQILTMLITGQEPQNLTPEQGASATDMMANLLLTSVLGGARIGTVTFDSDGTVRVGLPLGRVYAEGVYRLSPRLDENHYAVDFEVQLARRFVLDGAFGDRHSWLDVFYELRF